MVGNQAVFIYIAFIIIPFALFVIGCIWLYNQRRERHGKQMQSVYIFLVGTSVLTISFSISLFFQVKAASVLSYLSSSSVKEVYVNGTTISNRQQIDAIVSSLNHSQWFEFLHGETVSPVSFIVMLQSGETLNFAIGITQHQSMNVRGVLIEPIQGDLPQYLSGNLFYSDDLEQVLKDAGVVLNKQEDS